MRQEKEITEEVLSRAGRYKEVAPNLLVKEVKVNGTATEAMMERLQYILPHKRPQSGTDLQRGEVHP